VGRKRVVERLVGTGEGRRLVDPGTRLVLSALAVDTGRIAHFVAGAPPDHAFVGRLEVGLGEVIYVRDPAEVMEAALASSAIPGIFEPVRIRGREFVDPGGFANQPLHVALAAEADAVLVVLLSPSGRPSTTAPPESLFGLAGRLLEVARGRPGTRVRGRTRRDPAGGGAGLRSRERRGAHRAR
jgi:predicted acylesterase/phospholipase RssA